MGLRDAGHGFAVVSDANQCASQGIHGIAGQFPGPQAGAVDDGIDFKLAAERLCLCREGTSDLELDDAAAELANFAEQPRHVDVGVDHGGKMSVRVAQTECGVDAVLADQGSIVPETSDKFLEFFHLDAMDRVVVDRVLEVVGDGPEKSAGLWLPGELFEYLEGVLAPDFRAAKRNQVAMVAANGRGPFPKGARDDRRDLGANRSATTVTLKPRRLRQRAVVRPLTPAPITRTARPARAAGFFESG